MTQTNPIIPTPFNYKPKRPQIHHPSNLQNPKILKDTYQPKLHMGTYRFMTCLPATAAPAAKPPIAPAITAERGPAAARYRAPVPKPAKTLLSISSVSLQCIIPLSNPEKIRPRTPIELPNLRPVWPPELRTRLTRSLSVSPASAALIPSMEPLAPPIMAPER